MIRYFLLVLLVLPLTARAWPYIEVGNVVAHYYNEAGESPAPILQDGELHPSVVQSVTLDASQARELLSAIGADIPKHNQYLCHKPRHAFVFTPQAGGEKVALEVCFECLSFQYWSYPVREPGPWLDLVQTARLLSELGLPLGPTNQTVEDIRAEVHDQTEALEALERSVPNKSFNGTRDRAR